MVLDSLDQNLNYYSTKEKNKRIIEIVRSQASEYQGVLKSALGKQAKVLTETTQDPRMNLSKMSRMSALDMGSTMKSTKTRTTSRGSNKVQDEELSERHNEKASMFEPGTVRHSELFYEEVAMKMLQHMINAGLKLSLSNSILQKRYGQRVFHGGDKLRKLGPDEVKKKRRA